MKKSRGTDGSPDEGPEGVKIGSKEGSRRVGPHFVPTHQNLLFLNSL